jgi:hypothetical protein
MQGTLNPEYGKTVPVVFCSLKIGMPELWRILCVESMKHIKGVKDLNPFFKYRQFSVTFLALNAYAQRAKGARSFLQTKKENR